MYMYARFSRNPILGQPGAAHLTTYWSDVSSSPIKVSSCFFEQEMLCLFLNTSSSGNGFERDLDKPKMHNLNRTKKSKYILN